MKVFFAALVILAVASSPVQAVDRLFCREAVFPAIMTVADGFMSCQFRQIGNRVRAQCNTGFCDNVGEGACRARVLGRVQLLAPRFCDLMETTEPTPPAEAATRADCRAEINPAINERRPNFGVCQLFQVRSFARAQCNTGLCDSRTLEACALAVGRRVNGLLNRFCESG